MVGSIDPRCETVRGTHWPEDRSCGCLELASRKPTWPAVQSDRTNRPDIWMQAIRSDLKNLLCHGGRPHMGPGSRFACPGRQKLFSRHRLPEVLQEDLALPIRGRREDRVRAAPAVSCAMCIKKCCT